jgi:transcriptional regulator with XRE-family HTH domain
MSTGICQQVGKRIRTLRQKRGWRQVDLAVAAGVGKTHISDIENGKRELGLLTLERIANALGLPPGDLLV